VPDFASTLIEWQRRHGRHGLPWQKTRDPYRLWIAEVMLQQTQVAAVIPYYRRFLRRFPDVRALARATEEEVLRLWSGLGYYARARNLRRAAREIVERHGGRFPREPESLARLPGLGRSSAAAVAACAFGKRAAILDGNARRVLARCFGVEDEKDLWRLAERVLPRRGIRTYTQGLMDLGATVCVRARPRCSECPLARRCVARREDRVRELPAPRKRRAVPLREAVWLVLLRREQVLLERRPSTGLWGGLWTFPECDGRDVAGHCRRVLGCDVARTRGLEPVEHGFTHFRLRVRPLVCEVEESALRAEAPGRLWVDLADAAAAAVPQPVRKLLARLSGAGAL
jgi:A/G-specific adenine glycosylase